MQLYQHVTAGWPCGRSCSCSLTGHQLVLSSAERMQALSNCVIIHRASTLFHNAHGIKASERERQTLIEHVQYWYCSGTLVTQQKKPYFLDS
jgi:hypothetical protein